MCNITASFILGEGVSAGVCHAASVSLKVEGKRVTA